MTLVRMVSVNMQAMKPNNALDIHIPELYSSKKRPSNYFFFTRKRASVCIKSTFVLGLLKLLGVKYHCSSRA